VSDYELTTFDLHIFGVPSIVVRRSRS